MADVLSRSFTGGAPRLADDDFLSFFSQTFPLPPQLTSWRLVHPTPAESFAAFCLLWQNNVSSPQTHIPIGNFGVNLLQVLANTLTSQATRDPPTTWNEHTVSWPLLLPCGTATSVVASPHLVRKSKECYATVDKSLQPGDLQTLAALTLTHLP